MHLARQHREASQVYARARLPVRIAQRAALGRAAAAPDGPRVSLPRPAMPCKPRARSTPRRSAALGLYTALR